MLARGMGKWWCTHYKERIVYIQCTCNPTSSPGEEVFSNRPRVQYTGVHPYFTTLDEHLQHSNIHEHTLATNAHYRWLQVTSGARIGLFRLRANEPSLDTLSMWITQYILTPSCQFLIGRREWWETECRFFLNYFLNYFTHYFFSYLLSYFSSYVLGYFLSYVLSYFLSYLLSYFVSYFLIYRRWETDVSVTVSGDSSQSQLCLCQTLVWSCQSLRRCTFIYRVH